MINTGKLAGRTIFITGASRGIGKAIALKAARDGANIIIAAKTAQPHPKLPGTIYSAAEEVEKAGGRAHACIVDVRDEAQVRSAVSEAVAKFGGIDILVNNASAISLTGTIETDMKRYDLMHQINTRGTFLVSKECLPHLLNSNHAHILNISPPLNLNPRWFGPHVAYTMAKYGMSMCVLGMSHEFADRGVAVNALWPRTAIHTAAIEMLTGPDSAKISRKPEIMADAAYAVLIREPRQFTGKFLIDDEVLTEAGIKDITQYACDPSYADKLMDDFFLDPVSADKTAPKVAAAATGSGGKVAGLFAKIETQLSSEIVSKTQAVFQFNIEGDEKGTWYLDLKNGNGSCGAGAPQHTPDATLIMKSNNFFDMFSGNMKPAMAFMTGKLKVTGDLQKAMKLEKLMKSLKSAPAAAAPTAAAESAPPAGKVAGLFAKIETQLSPEVVGKTQAIFQFNIEGDEKGTWYLDLKNGSGSCGIGEPKEAPDATLTMKANNFFEMFSGNMKPAMAFMTGKLKITGDLQKAMKLEKLMKYLKAKA